MTYALQNSSDLLGEMLAALNEDDYNKYGETIGKFRHDLVNLGTRIYTFETKFRKDK